MSFKQYQQSEELTETRLEMAKRESVNADELFGAIFGVVDQDKKDAIFAGDVQDEAMAEAAAEHLGLSARVLEGQDEFEDFFMVKIADNPSFNLAIGLVIMLNALFLGLETDLNPYGESEFQDFWNMINQVFTIIFLIELLIRLEAHKMSYFKSVANLLDFSLVVVGVVEVFLLPYVSYISGQLSADGENVAWALNME